MARDWEEREGGRRIAWHQGFKSAGSGQQGHEGGEGTQVMTVGVPGVEVLPWSDGHHVGSWDRSCCQCRQRGTSRLCIPQIWTLDASADQTRRIDQKQDV